MRERLDTLRSTGVQRADREQVEFVDTGAQVSVPGVAKLLPVIVTPLVDGRFGPTAVLGVPEADAADRAIAERLPQVAGIGLKSSGGVKTRPAVRYKAADFPISRQRSWGPPIPLVHCERCGTVPVPKEQLPVRLPDELKLTGEGNPLERDEQFLACQLPELRRAPRGASRTRSTATSTACGCACRSRCRSRTAASRCSAIPTTSAGCRRGRSSGAPTPAATCSTSG